MHYFKALSRARAAIALVLSVLIPGLVAVSSVAAADRLSARNTDGVPSYLSKRKLDVPIQELVVASPGLRSDLQPTNGRSRVIVRLKSDPVARHLDQSPSGRISRKEELKYEQSVFVQRAQDLAPGTKLLASTQVVLNAIFLEVDSGYIELLAADGSVFSVNRVADYELSLSETVPYIGAAAVQAAGVDGSGVSVAVLDSGVDYTHAAFGGGGTLADYEAAWGLGIGDPTQTTRDGLFPTAKVVEGYDFVGELWPTFGPEIPDEDPIDLEGHGTHVADIIGGLDGVAPGADIYAVKVCSAVSSSCSGIALIQGMEYAVDPNGDGDPEDAVDIINMSLGSNYGQPFDDDLAAAVDNASALGVLTVASAGNGSNKPYVNGTPAAAATALSVAQTQVPSAELPFLRLNGVDYPAVFQSWSVAPTVVVSGPLQYGDGAGGNLNGCAPFAAGSLAGLAVLVDRGACNFTLKISNISQAGGELGVIGLVAPGDPFSGGDGGDRPIDIPGYMISQADSNTFKTSLGDILSVDPANGLQLVGQMVGSSSRGPQHDATTLIKPEIGAPGASVSAIAGTGIETGPFGGTSGAAPMVAGSAALLLQAEPDLSPAEAKARLINTGETNIETDPFAGLAPITRIGGGEVRVDRAVTVSSAAWEKDSRQGTLSFGFVDMDKSKKKLKKDVTLKNYSNKSRKYSVAANFRYADDEASGAIEFKLPSNDIEVKAGGTKKVKIEMEILGENLPDNTMSSGGVGADPATLTAQEFDGYITFSDGEETVHMPWHVLPRKSANIGGKGKKETKSKKSLKSMKAGDLKFKFDEDFGLDAATVKLDNKGVGTAQNDAYSLLATSPNIPEGGLGEQSPTPDIRAVGVTTIPVPAGFCSADDSFLWVFAFNTWERQQHLVPVSLQVELDTNQDGLGDYLVLNRDVTLNNVTDGRQLTWVVDLSTGSAGAFFFAEHATNTGNTALTICGEQVGLNASNFFNTPVDATFIAEDFYFGGPGDEVGGITITPLGEQYLGLPEDVPGNSEGEMTVLDFGPLPGNSPELGILLFTNGSRGVNTGGATEETEALVYEPKKSEKSKKSKK